MWSSICMSVHINPYLHTHTHIYIFMLSYHNSQAELWRKANCRRQCPEEKSSACEWRAGGYQKLKYDCFYRLQLGAPDFIISLFFCLQDTAEACHMSLQTVWKDGNIRRVGVDLRLTHGSYLEVTRNIHKPRSLQTLPGSPIFLF